MWLSYGWRGGDNDRVATTEFCKLDCLYTDLACPSPKKDRPVAFLLPWKGKGWPHSIIETIASCAQGDWYSGGFVFR